MDKERQINISEEEISPEDVWGNDFKFIEIIGHGSGRGFGIEGLNLPKGWEKRLGRLESVDISVIAKNFDSLCEEWEYSLEEINFDKNKVLKEVIIRNKTTSDSSSLILSGQIPGLNDGIYQAVNLPTIESVFLLQQLGARYLNIFDWGEFKHSYIVGEKGMDLGSAYLRIPKKILGRGETITNQRFQSQFHINASNIAGRFGLSLRRLFFDERGLLGNIDIDVSGSCGYYLDPSGNNLEYSSHNVDTLEQAATLHTIVASFINHLLVLDS